MADVGGALDCSCILVRLGNEDRRVEYEVMVASITTVVCVGMDVVKITTCLGFR